MMTKFAQSYSSTRSELLDYLDLVIGDKMEGWERLTGYQKISLKKRQGVIPAVVLCLY